MMAQIVLQKGILLSCLFLLLSSYNLSIKAQVSVGIFSGVNLTTLEISTTDLSPNRKAGAYLGLPVEINFSPYFALQTEVNYIQKGSKFNDSGNVQVLEGEGYWEEQTDINLNYLEFPIMGKIIIPVGSAEIFFLAGPRLGLALGGNQKYDSKEWLNRELIDHDTFEEKIQVGKNPSAEGNIKRFNFGINAGIGVGFNVGKGNIFTQCRWHDLGISNIVYEEGEWDGKIKNRDLSFTLGYMIDLGRQ